MTSVTKLRALLPLLAAAAGCSAPPDSPLEALVVEAPEAFGRTGDGPHLGASPWWQTFRSPSLDAAVNATVEGSLELQQAWARLAQAEASAVSAGAARIPSVDVGGSVTRLEIDQRGGGGAGLPVRVGEVYSLGPSLSYELDLFGRIDATADAARFAASATEADARATALTLTGRAADAWFTAVENAALERLVLDQVTTGEQLVEVTRTRFENGSGSALDVLQQQRQVESTRAELPRFRGAEERALNQLAVLAGRAPQEAAEGVPDALPPLPPLPALDVPGALLARRPDLDAAFQRLAQADRDVAAAIAARYPRLSISASYNFDSSELADLFDRTISTLTANITGPLIDGGQRRAEVRRTQAVLEERTLALSQAFLVALQEVEDALSLEARAVERTRALEVQRSLATEEVEQARRRYVGGVDTYLPVLTAITGLQALDRQLVQERAAALRARAQLLRALGGAWEDASPAADTNTP